MSRAGSVYEGNSDSGGSLAVIGDTIYNYNGYCDDDIDDDSNGDNGDANDGSSIGYILFSTEDDDDKGLIRTMLSGLSQK